jgi:hypothetical protein
MTEKTKMLFRQIKWHSRYVKHVISMCCKGNKCELDSYLKRLFDGDYNQLVRAWQREEVQFT